MIKRQKGCNDLFGREAKVWKYVDQVIDALMEKYNYNYIRTPIIEATELFHRGVGETTDIVTKESYDFEDKGGRKITLRPEGTAGVVRSYIENKMYGDPNQPVKVYYNGTMYRYERPQSGRDRELTQFGMEILGTDDPMSDAEIISLAVNIYKMLGITDIKVNINTLGDNESRLKYREALIEYFKPHIDELCEDCRERFEKNPLRILDCKVDGDAGKGLAGLALIICAIAIALAVIAIPAAGASQAEVPRSLVRVAPPFIVFSIISLSSSKLSKSLIE